MLANGADAIIIINATTLVNHTDVQFHTQAYQDRVDGCNAMHQAIVDANPKCYLADAFTAYGGHVVDGTLWGGYAGVDNIHPSNKGAALIGDTVAAVALTLL